VAKQIEILTYLLRCSRALRVAEIGLPAPRPRRNATPFAGSIGNGGLSDSRRGLFATLAAFCAGAQTHLPLSRR